MKFNKHYDLTLIEYYRNEQPPTDDFIEGKFFGTRFGSWEHLTYAVDKRTFECKCVDNLPEIEKVGSINMSLCVTIAGYTYFKTIQELEEYYLYELPIRIEKSKNAEKFPDLAFVSKHLVEMKHIIV